jgi:hypothetical protein
MGCSDIQDICDVLSGNMADPEKESYLYWECMMAKQVDCGYRKKKKFTIYIIILPFSSIICRIWKYSFGSGVCFTTFYFYVVRGQMGGENEY